MKNGCGKWRSEWGNGWKVIRTTCGCWANKMKSGFSLDGAHTHTHTQSKHAYRPSSSKLKPLYWQVRCLFQINPALLNFLFINMTFKNVHSVHWVCRKIWIHVNTKIFCLAIMFQLLLYFIYSFKSKIHGSGFVLLSLNIHCDNYVIKLNSKMKVEGIQQLRNYDHNCLHNSLFCWKSYKKCNGFPFQTAKLKCLWFDICCNIDW